MASDLGNEKRVSINLGDEFDEALRTKLFAILVELGASDSTIDERFVAGSQDFEKIAVIVNNQLLHVEAETYIGLSIEGPVDLIHQVQLKMFS